MKWNLRIIGVMLLSMAFILPSDFLEDQKRYPRVRAAITEKQSTLEKLVAQQSLRIHDLNILFVAYKESNELQLFGKAHAETTYKLLKTYSICARSGELGPKRKQGDMQVPEGFYSIDRFNPSSNYHLSLGINYPNLSDRRKSSASNLGGDIFIHGSCVTIGCLPMTNDQINEIYAFAVYAKNRGQKNIPVYIFPFKMTDKNMEVNSKKYATNTALISFWKNLKTGYDKFHTNKKALSVEVSSNGDYRF